MIPFIQHFKIYLLFLVALGLLCCVWAFSSCGEWGLLSVVVCRLLTEVASLVAEHRLQAHGLQYLGHVGPVVVAHRLQSMGSVVVVHTGLVALRHVESSGPGIEPVSRDSYPLHHHRSPIQHFCNDKIIVMKNRLMSARIKEYGSSRKVGVAIKG